MVLDRIVGATRQQFGYLCPLITPLQVRLVDDVVLLFRPRGFLDVGIQVIVPPLPTLLTDTTAKMSCDECPLFGAIFGDQLDHFVVLLFRPGSLDEVRINHLCPPLLTLDVGAIFEKLGDGIPTFTVLLHQ